MDNTNDTCDEDTQIIKSDVIQAINTATIHRICSGQVVLSLAIAVKELVENAIDASATNIEIRLKEYGSDLIEVLDNGSGVRKENFTALTLKHYTSKIREFSDLESVSTLGFRGEALSSLCALSDLTIATKHETAEYATKIQYDHNGKIISESPTARSQGTTISLVNIFATLPVRRKEFTKNLKREFNRMCQLLYAYCLVSKGIKFTCSNITSKSSKSVVVTTQGLYSVRDNIIAVFGSKQISSLIDIDPIPPDETILQEYGLKSCTSQIQFECFMSSVSHGNGRSTSDRQFYYINGRPCEPTKVMKLVNETYRHFNGHQYPFVYLNLLLEKSEIDVNVTPDKRQIFLEKEKLLLATLKASLLEAFKQFPSTFKMQNLDISRPQVDDIVPDISRGIKRNLSLGKSDANVSFLQSFKKRSKLEKTLNREEESSIVKIESKQVTLKDIKDFNVTIEEKPDLNRSFDLLVNMACKLVNTPKADKVIAVKILKEDTPVIEKEGDLSKIVLNDTVSSRCSSKVIQWTISMDQVRKSMERRQMKHENSEVCVRFRSKISPNSNQDAEKELQRQITKDMFKEMEVVGQFNLGFIISKLGSDLFIIDQHATDEKYNFEQLQQTTVMENQILVRPKSLELTAANESLLIDNVDIFRKNGFIFNINENAEATKKVFLTAIPVSRNYIFGKDDIDEMLFMLNDASKTMCRPSRVRSMFASRACRKSVMVGRALSMNEMKRLVVHMGEIDQPWNCPHGRPTMRHLINLGLISTE